MSLKFNDVAIPSPDAALANLDDLVERVTSTDDASRGVLLFDRLGHAARFPPFDGTWTDLSPEEVRGRLLAFLGAR